ncbi:uncharacterized protein THITE_2089074 [Thermothielavioides terrestris NRRL 8126]|uniref:Uncharacterized protein n=1 Tax=Thermothielavioides terrestris (strain ATCC 38088 / NRRL 8126) TaxID=578455 RepID=G2R646_THETT|nr:uncharacterized protein THITE_2089074 [Thermothielavioides terrestris NRRL 8126]AEO67583.1 hypothetical protein THITE_2089074 [Thermothielavioides terrestris NRRL 8126]
MTVELTTALADPNADEEATDETEGEARWQGNEKYHGDAGDDVALLQALLACFDGPAVSGAGGRIPEATVHTVTIKGLQTQHLHAAGSITAAVPWPIPTFSDEPVPTSTVSGGLSNNLSWYYRNPPLWAANIRSRAGSSTAARTASVLSNPTDSSAGKKTTPMWTMFSQDHLSSAEGTMRPETQPGVASKSAPSSRLPGTLPGTLFDISKFLTLSTARWPFTHRHRHVGRPTRP